MMQAGMANPELMAKLMQMRQGMQPPQNMPNANPGQAGQMLNNTQPMGMTMGQPSPEIIQQLLARRRMMQGNQPQAGMSQMGAPNPQPGMSAMRPVM